MPAKVEHWANHREPAASGQARERHRGPSDRRIAGSPDRGRTPYRYADGDVDIPKPAARLLRLLVLLRLTMSQRKFEDIVKQLH
jgi:hypothetical protein